MKRQANRAGADPAQPPPPARTMLLVDDSEPFRERLAVALRERGYAVWTASNYDEALAAAAEHRPALVTVDLRMPGRGGLELVRDLCSRAPEVRVLVLTGYGSIATAVEAMRLGAVNYLPKPADADDVLAAFQRAEPAAAGPRCEPPPDAAPPEREAPSLARAEWEHIHRVIADCQGNISEAARRLGIHRRSLQRKLRKRAPS